MSGATEEARVPSHLTQSLRPFLRKELPALSPAVEKAQRIELGERGLNDVEITLLLNMFMMREKRRLPDEANRLLRGTDWPAWSTQTVRISVDLHPGGRATLHERGRDFKVEYVFMRARLSNGNIALFRKSVQVVAEYNLQFNWLEMAAYDCALTLYLRRIPSQRDELMATALMNLPQPGRPPNTDFYKTLRETYDALVLDGVRAPVREIAQMYGVPEDTVKSWRRRGRIYAASS